MENSTLFWPTKQKGKKGTIVAMIAGTDSGCHSVSKKKATIRNTDFWDMTWQTGWLLKNVSNATRVTDSMCKKQLEGFTRNQIKYHWQTIDQGTWSYIEKQEKTKKFEPYVLTNGDSKQFLARSRYFCKKQIKVV
jgi:hypothetical protein